MKRVLVVEDDAPIRELTATILKANGYSVVEACHGGEALAICMHLEEPIDLILTDVRMPHMTGPEFIDRLRAVRNDFKVLYMSGYVGDVKWRRLISEKKINFIDKPFSFHELLMQVDNILETENQDACRDSEGQFRA